ncbi:hypothetical protein AWM70_06875 [Paenibacillus yonginensis]|uniref:Uncharacterized protein n=1 Tax=Paenibacillus yonginensis TaxID=1462996 RepID=A0A1B1MYS9_9BACL|nr:hypothetical protein [Paenibacillus yonginensis]ANS74340.1 hypothetical protein AWM70_06875 [Paenibacillus yonginensis]
MKKTIAVLFSVMLLASTIKPVSAEPSFGKIMIDSQISSRDRATLQNVMEGLDPEDRENVIYLYEDGTITANKVELINEFKAENANSIGPDGKLKLTPNNELRGFVENASDGFANEDSPITTYAYTNPNSVCTSDNAGPFRRVLSTTGKSRITANIYLPSKSASEVYISNSNTEQAYIYMGASAPGGELDMGLALNYAPGSSTTNETWGMFIKGDTSNDANFGNFKMGSEVFMKFYVVSSSAVALYVNGVNKSGVAKEYTLTAQVSSSKGFNTSGSNMQVKRLTTIAQKPQNLTSGSYLYNVHWYNVKVGTASGTEVLMDSTNTASACGYQISNVLVNYISQNNEYIKLKAGTLTP